MALLSSAVLVVLLSCEAYSDQNASQNPRSEITEQQAIEIAKNEILRRGVSLPRESKPWAAPVFSDTEPVRPIYWVTFLDPDRAEKGIHGYEVSLDRESGKVIDFVDPRTFITAQAAIEIAKKELLKHGVSVPRSWGVDVKHWVLAPEFRSARPLFGVSFSPPEKGKRAAVYHVAIEKRTGKVY